MDGSPPAGWRYAAIHELADVVSGGTPSRAISRYWGGSIPWATPTEVSRASVRHLDSTRESLTEAGAQAAGLRILPVGSVLVTTRATIGAVARARVPVTTNQGFQSLVPHADTDAAWLFHAIEVARPVLHSLAAGSTFKEVSRESFRKLRLLVAPPREQRAIAAVLDAIDEAIERTEAVIAATETLRLSLLHEVLTRGIPGEHNSERTVPDLGAIPACWKVTTLGSVLRSVVYGTNVPLSERGAGIPVVRMGDLVRGRINHADLKTASAPIDPGLSLTEGDILLNRTNSLALVGKVGYVADLREPTSFASYLLRLRAEPTTTDSRWLFEVLHAPRTQERLGRMATPGASQANINPTSLKSLVIAVPSLSEQRRIGRLIEAVRGLGSAESSRADHLRRLKISTADALLSGRVRTSASHQAA